MRSLPNAALSQKPTARSQKLASYTALASAFVALTPAKADVVYVNLDPDVDLSVIPQGDTTYLIDINGDGDDDFAIYASRSYEPGYNYAAITISAYGLNYVMAREVNVPTSNSSTSFVEGLVLEPGAQIGASAEWASYAAFGGDYSDSGCLLYTSPSPRDRQ